MATEIWKSLNFSEVLEEQSLLPGGPIFTLNHSISYSFRDKGHFPFPVKFKIAAEIIKSLSFSEVLLVLITNGASKFA